MNLYVKQAIKHYQDNLNRFNRIAADCVDMLTSDKSTDRLEWYLRGHYIYRLLSLSFMQSLYLR